MSKGQQTMPKMKTNRGAAKRFRKKTAGSKIKRGTANRRHILTKKNIKRKRELRKGDCVHENDKKLIERLLPYL